MSRRAPRFDPMLWDRESPRVDRHKSEIIYYPLHVIYFAHCIVPMDTISWVSRKVGIKTLKYLILNRFLACHVLGFHCCPCRSCYCLFLALIWILWICTWHIQQRWSLFIYIHILSGLPLCRCNPMFTKCKFIDYSTHLMMTWNAAG